MKTFNILIALLSTIALAACEGEPGESLQNNIDTTNTNSSTFDPSNSVIPFPNDLLFKGDAECDCQRGIIVLKCGAE